jgi:MoxR-like ATPase
MSIGAYDIRVVNDMVERESAFVDRLMTEVHKVVVGQDEMIERVFMGLLCGGHVLLEGAPGLAKTLTVSTLARALKLDFKRVQFTPDLLPSDVLGTVIYNHQTGTFTNRAGRCSPTCCWPTRSTARRPRSRARCSSRWPSAR